MKKLLALLLLAGCAMPSKTEGWCLPKLVILTMSFMLVFAATSSNAAPSGTEEREIQTYCKDGLCVVRQADLEWMSESNKTMAERLEKAEKAPPKCAKVEVTEPPKKIPPIKRERDS